MLHDQMTLVLFSFADSSSVLACAKMTDILLTYLHSKWVAKAIRAKTVFSRSIDGRDLSIDGASLKI